MIKKHTSISTVFSILTAVLFLVSLIPILYVSFYSHPLYDDFGFSSGVHSTIVNGGNIFDVLMSSFSQARASYFDWQGTFSAIFIFSLQPAVFSDNLYFLTTFIMIFALSFSTFFFIETIIVKWFKSKLSYAVIISSLILICSIQFVIDKNQAFYWFNGSSYYTLFYSFSLTFFSVIIRMYLANINKRRITPPLCILASFLAIIIGGGNYTTALVSTIITFLILVYVFKNKLSYKSLYIIIFLFLLVPFIISIIAPGNSVRAALEQSGGMSAIKSIIMSVFYAFVYLGTWTKLPQIIIFIFITPILFVISKNVNFRFKYPIIAIVLSFLCFSAQLTPPLYALSSVGSERQIDIYYYSYYLLIAFNIFYISGWINRKEIIDIKLINNFIIKNFIPISAVLLLLFAAGCFEYGIKNLTSVDTALSVLNGSVYEYDKEYDTAIEQIISGNGVVEEIKTVPDFFGELKISKDSDYWINRQLAGYFNVDKVELKE